MNMYLRANHISFTLNKYTFIVVLRVGTPLSFIRIKLSFGFLSTDVQTIHLNFLFLY